MAWLLGGPSLPWVFANSQGLKAAHIFCSTYRVLKVAHLTSSASSPQISSHMVPCVCLSPPELLKTHILHNPGVLKVYEGLSGTGTRHDFHIQNWPNRNCIEHRVCRAAWSNHSCRTIVKPLSRSNMRPIWTETGTGLGTGFCYVPMKPSLAPRITIKMSPLKTAKKNYKSA